MIVSYDNNNVIVSHISIYGGIRIAEELNGERYDVITVRGFPCKDWVSLECYSLTSKRGRRERRLFRGQN